jgi:chromosome segregation ATPase
MRRLFAIVLLLPLCLAPASPTAAARPVRTSAGGGEMLNQFGNMQMEVSNPQSALAAAERAVRKLGGDIQHSSSDIDNGSLNASVPRSQLGELMQVMRSISGRVTHSSTSSSDLTANVHTAEARLRDLALAEAELAKALKNASTPDATRGLMILHELGSRERQNFESQLDSFRQQAERAQFSISFTRVR